MASTDSDDEIIAFDPYALPPEDVQEPPRSLGQAFRKIGPGIILAGTIVGSGELILTTKLGAEHGFIFLWLILFSCVIKVFVQIELGRYAISSGKPTLGALSELPGKTPFGHPLVWWWMVMMICTVFQLGGMTGGVGQALNLAFPSVSPKLVELLGGSATGGTGLAGMIHDRPEMPWAVAICLLTAALIYRGGYRRIETLTTVIVVSVTLITMTAALALFWTDFPIKANEFLEGLEFKLPKTGIAAAFAVFGITGVGASELFYYPYWCLEKGYARFTGRHEESETWANRAKGWIRVMHLDAWVSMVVFTISTVAFYVMGAAVLHPQGLLPANKDMVETLSQMYVGPFGAWARIVFLIGASAVLFKTLYLSCAANSRLTADFLALCNFIKPPTAEQRAGIIQKFCLFFPVLALAFFVLLKDPALMVLIGGLAQAATLPMIALATVYFRIRKVDRRLRPWPVTDVMLAVATIAILLAAGTQVYQLLTK
jgi:Mn2+/Fe2+ NRAMP family transporter